MQNTAQLQALALQIFIAKHKFYLAAYMEGEADAALRKLQNAALDAEHGRVMTAKECVAFADGNPELAETLLETFEV